MKIEKSPAFQFYPRDWISSLNVKLMTNSERGAYMNLLSHCWLNNGLPQDLDSLAKLADEPLDSFKTIWKRVEKCFYLHHEKFWNKRLVDEAKKQRDFSKRQRTNSEKRWKKSPSPSEPRHSQKDAKPMPKRCFASSSSFASSITTNKDIVAVGSSPTSQPVQDLSKPYQIDSPLKRVVCGWKVITGFEAQDRAWDKAHWARTAKSAKTILDFLDGNSTAAIDCCEDIRREMSKNNLTCTIETVVKHMADWKIKNSKQVMA